MRLTTMRLVPALTAIVFMIGACDSAEVASMRPTDDPSPGPASAPSEATVVVTPQPPSPSPTAGITERERSDRYWASVTDFDVYSLTYDSLPDITRNVHLIVRGRVTSLQDGEIQPFEGKRPRRTRFGLVRIDEVLAGTPQTNTPGTILVADLGVVTTTDDDLPDGEVILFLMNYARMRSEAGFSPSSDQNDGYYYARPNGYQGVLRNLDGFVDLVQGPPDWEVHFGPYPSQLDGDSFGSVLNRVRALAAT